MGSTLVLMKPCVAANANEQPSIDACYCRQKQAMLLITVKRGTSDYALACLLVAFTSWYLLIRNMHKCFRMHPAEDP